MQSVGEVKRYRSGAIWEKAAGYSRAVRSGNSIFIAGTIAIGTREDGSTGIVHVGNPYGQATRCLEIIFEALRELGAEAKHVVRTRLYVKGIKEQWKEFGRAHSDFFKDHPPACTMVEVSSLVNEEALIEIECDAVVW